MRLNKLLMLFLSIFLYSTVSAGSLSYGKTVTIGYLNLKGLTAKEMRLHKFDKEILKQMTKKKGLDYFIVTGVKDRYVRREIATGMFPYVSTVHSDSIDNYTFLLTGISVNEVRPKMFHYSKEPKVFHKSPVLFKIGRFFGIVVFDFEQNKKMVKNKNGKKTYKIVRTPTSKQMSSVEKSINNLLARSKLTRDQIVVVGNFNASPKKVNSYLRGYIPATTEGTYITVKKNNQLRVAYGDNIFIPDVAMKNIVGKSVGTKYANIALKKYPNLKNPYLAYGKKVARHLPVFLSIKIKYKK